MTLPISSLANMEYMLYGGGLGFNPNCPSYLNGYRANSAGLYSNPYMYNGMYQNAWNNPYVNNQTNGTIWQNQSPVQTSSQTTETTNSLNNAKDVDILSEYYKKHSNYEEAFSGALIGGLGFTAFENPQTVKHPFNSIKAMQQTSRTFNKLMRQNPALKAMWSNEPRIMQDAYAQLHAVNRNAQGKWKYVQQWFQKPIDSATRTELEKIMVDALKSGDKDAIIKATETLRASRGMDGYIPTAWNKVRQFFGANPDKARNFTPMERIANKTAAIDKAVAEKSLGWAKRGLREGKGWIVFDMIFSAPNIIKAFRDGGVNSGVIQTGQSLVKAAGNAVGWVAGRAVGSAVGAKAGAAIGTAICPGIGTAAGAIIGFVGGCVGSWLMGKVTNKLIPTEEATRLDAEKMKKTPEGQVQLIQMALAKAQAGEEVPQNVLNAAQNAAQRLSA